MNDGPRMRISDEELLEAIRSEPGSMRAKRAASDLFGRYHGLVYRWCRKLIADADLAEDIAQDAMIGAYRKLESFEGRAKFSSWLFAIVRNRCIGALRRPALFEPSELAEDGLIDPGLGPDRELELLEEEEVLEEMLSAHLTKTEQEAFCLRCFERMPVDEITATLGIASASGARGVLQSARRKLRVALKRKDPRHGGGDHE